MSTAIAVRRLLVSGQVQGVGYRCATTVAAARFGVAGWVRNLADGRVEIAVSGPPESVARLIAWARSGPPVSRVEAVLVEEGGADWLSGENFVQRSSADAPDPL